MRMSSTKSISPILGLLPLRAWKCREVVQIAFAQIASRHSSHLFPTQVVPNKNSISDEM